MILRRWLLSLLAVAAPCAFAQEGTNPFADDLGYPWSSSLPYGVSGLYRLTKPRGALDYHRFETSDIRKSSVSKTTASGHRDVVQVSGYAPVTKELTLGGEGFLRRGKTEVRFTAEGLDDLNYRYERNVRSTAAVFAYGVTPSIVLGARYGAYYLEDRADTSELGLFGTEDNDKQNFRVLEPSATWHGDKSEVTVAHQPKVDRRLGTSSVTAPAVASLWYLYKPRAPTTLMAGVAYAWYGAFADGEVNAPEFAVGQRRWMEYGDVGLILRYKSPHYAQKADAQPNNVDLTVIELVSHAQLFGDFELGVQVGYGFGSGKGETEARKFSVDSEQLDALVTLAKGL